MEEVTSLLNQILKNQASLESRMAQQEKRTVAINKKLLCIVRKLQAAPKGRPKRVTQVDGLVIGNPLTGKGFKPVVLSEKALARFSAMEKSGSVREVQGWFLPSEGKGLVPNTRCCSRFFVFVKAFFSHQENCAFYWKNKMHYIHTGLNNWTSVRQALFWEKIKEITWDRYNLFLERLDTAFYSRVAEVNIEYGCPFKPSRFEWLMLVHNVLFRAAYELRR